MSKHQSSLALGGFMQSESLKNVMTKLLLSLSLSCILFICTPWLPLFLHSTHPHLSFPSSPLHDLFSHTIDRNNIFLLCNGILAFLALLGAASPACDEASRNENLLPSMVPENEGLVVKEGEAALKVEASHLELENDDYVIEGATDAKEINAYDEKGEAEDGSIECEVEIINGNKCGISFQDGEMEEEEEGRNGLLSAEELNRKFDEFIRKMKEDIRIEAQQHLVMVY